MAKPVIPVTYATARRRCRDGVQHLHVAWHRLGDSTRGQLPSPSWSQEYFIPTDKTVEVILSGCTPGPATIKSNPYFRFDTASFRRAMPCTVPLAGRPRHPCCRRARARLPQSSAPELIVWQRPIYTRVLNPAKPHSAHHSAPASATPTLGAACFYAGLTLFAAIPSQDQAPRRHAARALSIRSKRGASPIAHTSVPPRGTSAQPTPSSIGSLTSSSPVGVGL